MENHEHEADDQGDRDSYYEQGDDGEYYEPEEEYIEEEDGEDDDDFEKKLGVMFSSRGTLGFVLLSLYLKRG
ncbi:hypothetical protein V6N13_012754 [Hibiscus sabdariffa]